MPCDSARLLERTAADRLPPSEREPSDPFHTRLPREAAADGDRSMALARLRETAVDLDGKPFPSPATTTSAKWKGLW